MEDESQKELQLLPRRHSIGSSSSGHMSSSRPPSISDSSLRFRGSGPLLFEPGRGSSSSSLSSSVDLQLSISLRPMMIGPAGGCVEAVKWEAAEQIRLAGMEKAYAERVRELTKREIELAETEFARAREMWERAREEVEKAQRMKEIATRQMDSTRNMEITCQSCRHSFRP